MSATEITHVYDEAGKVIGSLTRDEAERDYHLTSNALIFIFDRHGRVWSQLRPKDKKHFPGLWDITACGGLLAGEAALEAARRELMEETGLAAKLVHVETFMNVFPGAEGRNHRRLSHLYIGESEGTPVTGTEADEFRLWEPGELRAALASRADEFVPPFAAEFEKAMKAYQLVFGAGRQT